MASAFSKFSHFYKSLWVNRNLEKNGAGGFVALWVMLLRQGRDEGDMAPCGLGLVVKLHGLNLIRHLGWS